jgi:hypothetical protein
VVAAEVVKGIQDDRFYIVPAQPFLQDLVNVRMTDLLERRNPTMPPARPSLAAQNEPT